MSLPKPTALKLLHGNAGHRPLNPNEPKPNAIAPCCPQHVEVDPEAKAYWDHYLPILMSMKVLTEADEAILAMLCITHSQFLWHLAKIREKNESSVDGQAGIISTTKTGYMATNPLYLNMRNLMDQELKICRELGLTPSARTRISTVTTTEAQESPWAELKSGTT